MTGPEKKEEGDADQDGQLEEDKKTADATALTLIALGSSGSLFWVMTLACTRWNVVPSQDLLFFVVWIACMPMICLFVYRNTSRPEFIERVFKASAYLCLATAALSVGGLQAAHVARYGWSHWGCLGADQAWQDKHAEIYGTIAGFRCGAEECTREQAARNPAPRMIVELDGWAWYEARPGPVAADCRTVTFQFKPGAWLPESGSRVAVDSDICRSIMPRADAAWHPIR